MKFDELDLLSVGNTIQLAGAIYAGEGKILFCYLPHEEELRLATTTENLEMDLDDWNKFLRQTDLVEVEARVKDEDGKIVKALIRKCQRQISQHVSWNVFRRDGFRCRYCYRDDVPLTVDHLLLWKDGGPSIEANLLSSCRKCNQTRGTLEYSKWLKHPYYKRVSQNLSGFVRDDNEALVATLDVIEKRPHKRSR